jgi:hypothetical protein
MATDIPLEITTPDHNLEIYGGVNSMKILTISLAVMFVALASNVRAQSTGAESQPQTFEDRLMYSRAVEAAIWSRPFTGIKALIDGLQRDAGVGYNDIGYFSRLQNSKFKWPTTNVTTPYAIAYWNAEKEPVVVEIPPATPDVSVFGLLADSWQRWIADVGPGWSRRWQRRQVPPHNS